MAPEAFKEQKPQISFSSPVQLNDFYRETSTKNLKEAAAILLDAYKMLGAKNTPMGDKLAFIVKNPGLVQNGLAAFEVKTAKNGGAIYSVKVTENGKNKDVSIFLLYVSEKETSLSYFVNDNMMEMHLHDPKKNTITHNVPS